MIIKNFTRLLKLTSIFFFSFNLYSFGSNFLVAPTRLEINLSKTRAASYIVSNTSKEPIRLRILPKYYTLKQTDNLTPLPNRTHIENLARYIKISPRTVSLKPGEQRTVRVLVKAPKTLKDGEYRAHMLFSPVDVPKTKAYKNKKTNKTMGVAFKVELATAIYGQKGKSKPKLVFNCFIDKRNKACLTIKNLGLTRFDGWVNIFDINKKQKLTKEKIFLLRESKLNKVILKKFNPIKTNKYSIEFRTLNGNKLISFGSCKFKR